MTLLTEVKVPDVGDVADMDVIEVLVKVGDVVAVEQTLAVLETDKASMDLPSSAAGIVKSVHFSVGDKVSEGALVVILESGESVATEEVIGVEDVKIDIPEQEEVPVAQPVEASGSIIEVKVPDVGDVADIDVIEVLIQTGDTVEKEQTLAVLETDKASMDLPSTDAGIVKDVFIKVGDKVSEGALIISLEVQSAESPVAAVNQQEKTAAPVSSSAPTPAPVKQSVAASNSNVAVVSQSGRSAHASPSVRLFARELGVDISQITQGSGRKGRILKDDVKNFIKQVMTSGVSLQGGAGIPPIPAVDFSKFGEIQEQKLSKIQRLTGQNLSRVWLNLPLVTYHDEADISEMEAFRKALNADKSTEIKVTGLIFIVKALVAAMQHFPKINSSLSPDGESLILKKYFNVGIAVDTPNGLVVPVLKGVDKKGIAELTRDLSELSEKARNGKLLPADMRGGCITISSLGGIGGKAFTPIVNAPEVAILGVTRSEMKPVWNGSEFEPKLMLPLDLTYDHRVIDGAEGARFMSTLIKYLGDIRRLLL
ncbi:MAG: dihydrolipoyllysine-residue acetyltransferase [Gammaproteobacteria bacterium]|jgi:pyruvate dehydrogenase E2 component (dihydrolipoamide acetyltransferase)|nr:dihydrolipoyllysine-residue acetyltransferase [Gammaproteobacteria bacterium]MBT5826525.1 dihydrolipoyllysine-residue acetyltransferase [Gammaproteobacteria bacterium]MBT6421216.1 dihydrolipoyllysine-residue acetyltransferase [Gammaproteobacteria bacterium]MBT6576391.1 dihydrolipoyllysine-residue acetyltransferase [Gammaproteobacteria bacterium]MBT7435882.1 dihydrolipoyllysine-residue acetyltransferase [Gammaproteobacteria bacterium]